MSPRYHSQSRSTRLWLVLLLVTFPSLSTCSRPLGAATQDVATRSSQPSVGVRQRSLLVAADVSSDSALQQCTWSPGVGCSLGPGFVAKSLAYQSEVPVAQFLAASLTCKSITNRGDCAPASECTWDDSYADGQAGCFVADAKLAALQQQCAVPRYKSGASSLQRCLARSGGCQCRDTASCAALLAAPGASVQCPSLLGCWMSSMLGSSVDVTELVQVQLRQVMPQLDALGVPRVDASGSSSSSSSTGRSSGRRRLLQAPKLPQPFLDAVAMANAAIETEEKGAPPVIQAGLDRLQAALDKAAADAYAAASDQPQVGASLPLVSVSFNLSAVSPPPQPVVIPPPATQVNSIADSGNVLVQESGAVGGAPSSGGGSSGGAGSPSSITAPIAADDALKPGSVPLSFWNCVASAAASVDASHKWAALQAASKKQTLDAYMAAIKPLETMAWGVRVLGCFQEQAPFSPVVAPFMQAHLFTLAQLTRVMTDSYQQFDTFFSNDTSSQRVAHAAYIVHTLANSIIPDPLSKLAGVYENGGVFAFDVVLQAQAILTDMKWAVRESEMLVLSRPSAAPAVLRAHMVYCAATMGRMLKWLLSVQFGVQPVYTQGSVAATAAGNLVAGALDTEAAAYLPAVGVQLSNSQWVQARSMLLDALNTAVNATAAVQLEAGAGFEASMQAMGNAHVIDLWTRRMADATAAALPERRAAALSDRSTQRSWQAVLEGQVGMLQALITGVQPQPVLQSKATAAWRWKLLWGMAKFVAAGAEGINPDVVQNGIDAQLLAVSASLANSTAACFEGSGTLITPNRAAAAVDVAQQDACDALEATTDGLLTLAIGQLSSNQPLWVTAFADLSAQWHCNSKSVASCQSDAMCASSVLPPGGTPDAQPLLVCAAADASVGLAGLLNQTVDLMAAGAGCGQLLGLPVCDGRLSAAQCGAAPQGLCQWRPGQASVRLMAGGSGTAAVAVGSSGASATRRGDCSTNWDAVMQQLDNTSRASFLQHAQECQEQSEASACAALAARAVGAPAPVQQQDSFFARTHGQVWLPLLAVALLAGLLGAGIVFMRRRRLVTAAEDARALLRHQRKRKGGKKRIWKRKIKRAEPGGGSYSRDLMRDSFTDYMRPGPGEFTIGAGTARLSDDGSTHGGSSSGMAGGSGPSSGRSSFVENPLASLRDDVGGARLLLAPGVSSLLTGASSPFEQQQQARQSAEQQGSPRAGSFGCLTLPRAPRRSGQSSGSRGASLARRSVGRSLHSAARGSHASSSLRVRVPNDQSHDAGGTPHSSCCHDSVDTLGQSGTVTPALSLSRESWTSLDLVVTAQLPPTAAPSRDRLL